LFLNNKNKGIFKGKKHGFEKTKREEEPNERKTKKQKKKRKNTPRAGGFFKNSGCYAFLGGFKVVFRRCFVFCV
jgi:hypothetical protein